MRKVLLAAALLISTAVPAAAAEFTCPYGGTVTVIVKKDTTLGEVICITDRINFEGTIALPEPDQQTIYIANCKGGDK